MTEDVEIKFRSVGEPAYESSCFVGEVMYALKRNVKCSDFELSIFKAWPEE